MTRRSALLLDERPHALDFAADGVAGSVPEASHRPDNMRKEFRATAEARKRPPLVAEAMVDADVEMPELSDNT